MRLQYKIGLLILVCLAKVCLSMKFSAQGNLVGWRDVDKLDHEYEAKIQISKDPKNKLRVREIYRKDKDESYVFAEDDTKTGNTDYYIFGIRNTESKHDNKQGQKVNKAKNNPETTTKLLQGEVKSADPGVSTEATVLQTDIFLYAAKRQCTHLIDANRHWYYIITGWSRRRFLTQLQKFASTLHLVIPTPADDTDSKYQKTITEYDFIQRFMEKLTKIPKMTPLHYIESAKIDHLQFKAFIFDARFIKTWKYDYRVFNVVTEKERLEESKAGHNNSSNGTHQETTGNSDGGKETIESPVGKQRCKENFGGTVPGEFGEAITVFTEQDLVSPKRKHEKGIVETPESRNKRNPTNSTGKTADPENPMHLPPGSVRLNGFGIALLLVEPGKDPKELRLFGTHVVVARINNRKYIKELIETNAVDKVWKTISHGNWEEHVRSIPEIKWDTYNSIELDDFSISAVNIRLSLRFPHDDKTDYAHVRIPYSRSLTQIPLPTPILKSYVTQTEIFAKAAQEMCLKLVKHCSNIEHIDALKAKINLLSITSMTDDSTDDIKNTLSFIQKYMLEKDLLKARDFAPERYFEVKENGTQTHSQTPTLKLFGIIFPPKVWNWKDGTKYFYVEKSIEPQDADDSEESKLDFVNFHENGFGVAVWLLEHNDGGSSADGKRIRAFRQELRSNTADLECLLAKSKEEREKQDTNQTRKKSGKETSKPEGEESTKLSSILRDVWSGTKKKVHKATDKVVEGVTTFVSEVVDSYKTAFRFFRYHKDYSHRWGEVLREFRSYEKYPADNPVFEFLQYGRSGDLCFMLFNTTGNSSKQAKWLLILKFDQEFSDNFIIVHVQAIAEGGRTDQQSSTNWFERRAADFENFIEKTKKEYPGIDLALLSASYGYMGWECASQGKRYKYVPLEHYLAEFANQRFGLKHHWKILMSRRSELTTSDRLPLRNKHYMIFGVHYDYVGDKRLEPWVYQENKHYFCAFVAQDHIKDLKEARKRGVDGERDIIFVLAYGQQSWNAIEACYELQYKYHDIKAKNTDHEYGMLVKTRSVCPLLKMFGKTDTKSKIAGVYPEFQTIVQVGMTYRAVYFKLNDKYKTAGYAMIPLEIQDDGEWKLGDLQIYTPTSPTEGIQKFMEHAKVMDQADTKSSSTSGGNNTIPNDKPIRYCTLDEGKLKGKSNDWNKVCEKEFGDPDVQCLKVDNLIQYDWDRDIHIYLFNAPAGNVNFMYLLLIAYIKETEITVIGKAKLTEHDFAEYAARRNFLKMFRHWNGKETIMNRKVGHNIMHGEIQLEEFKYDPMKKNDENKTNAETTLHKTLLDKLNSEEKKHFFCYKSKVYFDEKYHFIHLHAVVFRKNGDNNDTTYEAADNDDDVHGDNNQPAGNYGNGDHVAVNDTETYNTVFAGDNSVVTKNETTQLLSSNDDYCTSLANIIPRRGGASAIDSAMNFSKSNNMWKCHVMLSEGEHDMDEFGSAEFETTIESVKNARATKKFAWRHPFTDVARRQRYKTYSADVQHYSQYKEVKDLKRWVVEETVRYREWNTMSHDNTYKRLTSYLKDFACFQYQLAENTSLTILAIKVFKRWLIRTKFYFVLGFTEEGIVEGPPRIKKHFCALLHKDYESMLKEEMYTKQHGIIMAFGLHLHQLHAVDIAYDLEHAYFAQRKKVRGVGHLASIKLGKLHPGRTFGALCPQIEHVLQYGKKYRVTCYKINTAIGTLAYAWVMYSYDEKSQQWLGCSSEVQDIGDKRPLSVYEKYKNLIKSKEKHENTIEELLNGKEVAADKAPVLVPAPLMGLNTNTGTNSETLLIQEEEEFSDTENGRSDHTPDMTRGGVNFTKFRDLPEWSTVAQIKLEDKIEEKKSSEFDRFSSNEFQDETHKLLEHCSCVTMNKDPEPKIVKYLEKIDTEFPNHTIVTGYTNDSGIVNYFFVHKFDKLILFYGQDIPSYLKLRSCVQKYKEDIIGWQVADGSDTAEDLKSATKRYIPQLPTDSTMVLKYCANIDSMKLGIFAVGSSYQLLRLGDGTEKWGYICQCIETLLRVRKSYVVTDVGWDSNKYRVDIIWVVDPVPKVRESKKEWTAGKIAKKAVVVAIEIPIYFLKLVDWGVRKIIQYINCPLKFEDRETKLLLLLADHLQMTPLIMSYGVYHTEEGPNKRVVKSVGRSDVLSSDLKHMFVLILVSPFVKTGPDTKKNHPPPVSADTPPPPVPDDTPPPPVSDDKPLRPCYQSVMIINFADVKNDFSLGATWSLYFPRQDLAQEATEFGHILNGS